MGGEPLLEATVLLHVCHDLVECHTLCEVQIENGVFMRVPSCLDVIASCVHPGAVRRGSQSMKKQVGEVCDALPDKSE